MPPGNPCKIRVGKPYFATFVFENQEPHRPIEPRVRLGRDALCSERRIAEYQQGRRPQLDASVTGELGLINLIEEFDALAGDIRFQFRNGLRERVSAFDFDDSVVACRRPRDCQRRGDEDARELLNDARNHGGPPVSKASILRVTGWIRARAN